MGKPFKLVTFRAIWCKITKKIKGSKTYDG